MAYPSSSSLVTQMLINPIDRPRYRHEQVQAYFKRIQLPQQHLSSPVLTDSALASTKEYGLPLLRAMHLYHLSHIPFENLELHYSAHKIISLNMDDLFEKFVTKGARYGRGGRCMENNGLFGTILRSLGYNVRNCAGRVSRMWSPLSEIREHQGDTYDQWNHMLNLVKIEGQWWVVDVGMGSKGPATIFPLEDGFEGINVPPRKIRLQKRAIPEHYAMNDEEAQKLWCYDQCLRPDQPDKEDYWIPTYCFTETEFLPQDYEMMSFYTSTNPRSFFTYSVLCTKLVLDDAGERVVGDISLFNDVIQSTIGGKRKVLAELKTDKERVEALKEIFGVELTEGERNGISLERRV